MATVITNSNITIDGNTNLSGTNINADSATITNLSGTNVTASGDIKGSSFNGGQLGGRRNLIINGGMQVWQRATSANGVGSGGGTYETADRWKLLVTTADTTVNSSQQAFTLGQTDVPGEPEFYLRSDITTSAGASTYYVLAQHIEDVRSLAGQTATLSFWARSSVNENKVGIEFNQHFGGGSTRVTSAARDSVTLSTSWQKFSVTVDIPSISGKAIGTTSSSYLELYFWCSAGTNHDFRSSSTPVQTGQFDFALIQLEVGDTATPFEHRSYGEELALCQRYYIQTPYFGAQKRMINSTGSTFALCVSGDFPVTMRASPSMTVYGDISDTGQITLGAQGNFSTPYGFTAFTSVYNGGFLDMNYYIAYAEL